MNRLGGEGRPNPLSIALAEWKQAPQTFTISTESAIAEPSLARRSAEIAAPS